jgi:hypothetical protein
MTIQNNASLDDTGNGPFPSVLDLAELVHAYLSESARLWHYSGMANWKIGSALMCSKDYDGMKQGMKGIIIEEFGMMSYNWVISYLDGAKKLTCKGDDMDKYFVQI